jgi:hypothetical protein
VRGVTHYNAAGFLINLRIVSTMLQQFYCASTRLRITACEDSSQPGLNPPNPAPRPLMSLYSCGLLVSCQNMSRSYLTSGDTVSLGQEIPAATDRLKRILQAIRRLVPQLQMLQYGLRIRPAQSMLRRSSTLSVLASLPPHCPHRIPSAPSKFVAPKPRNRTFVGRPN